MNNVCLNGPYRIRLNWKYVRIQDLSILITVLGITPGKLIGSSFNIWTLVTHCFIENSLVMLIAGYTVILGSSRFLEPVWGQVEFSIFFGVVNVAAGLGFNLFIFRNINQFISSNCPGLLLPVCRLVQHQLPVQYAHSWLGRAQGRGLCRT